MFRTREERANPLPDNHHREMVQTFMHPTPTQTSTESPPLSQETREKVRRFIEANGGTYESANPCEYSYGTQKYRFGSLKEAFEDFVKQIGKEDDEQAAQIFEEFAGETEAKPSDYSLGRNQYQEELKRMLLLEKKFDAFCMKYGVTVTGRFTCAINGTRILKGMTRGGLFRDVVEALKGDRPDEVDQDASEIPELFAFLRVADSPLNTSVLSCELPLPPTTASGTDDPRGAVRSNEEWDRIWLPEWEQSLEAVVDFLEEGGIQFGWKIEQLSTLTGRWTFEWEFPEDWEAVEDSPFTPMKVESFEELFDHLTKRVEGIVVGLKAYYANEPKALQVIEELAPPVLKQLREAPHVNREEPQPNVQPTNPTDSSSRKRAQVLALVTVLGLAAIAIGMRHYFLSRQLPGITLGKKYV